MSFDLKLLANKLKDYRNQFKLDVETVANHTGLELSKITQIENAVLQPSGDEILILTDFYKCDYKFLISNDKIEPLDETNSLYRKYDDDFSIDDRWSIQELLYLAECESFLQNELGKNTFIKFEFIPTGTYYKGHAKDAAQKLRNLFGLDDKSLPLDVFSEFRTLGLHIFRRRLNNSKISGLFIDHPSAGKCILVNYSEDIFRQRYSVCHEVAHSIFDTEDKYVVSFTKWPENNLIEIRAEYFASNYLLPPSIINKLDIKKLWNEKNIIDLSIKMKVSTTALATSLLKNKIIKPEQYDFIKSVKVSRELKIDPELSINISPNGLKRKQFLLEKGLSTYYVNLCFEAYDKGIITASRMAEMLLVPEKELFDITDLFRLKINYGS